MMFLAYMIRLKFTIRSRPVVERASTLTGLGDGSTQYHHSSNGRVTARYVEQSCVLTLQDYYSNKFPTEHTMVHSGMNSYPPTNQSSPTLPLVFCPSHRLLTPYINSYINSLKIGSSKRPDFPVVSSSSVPLILRPERVTRHLRL